MLRDYIGGLFSASFIQLSSESETFSHVYTFNWIQMNLITIKKQTNHIFNTIIMLENTFFIFSRIKVTTLMDVSRWHIYQTKNKQFFLVAQLLFSNVHFSPDIINTSPVARAKFYFYFLPVMRFRGQNTNARFRSHVHINKNIIYILFSFIFFGVIVVVSQKLSSAEQRH